MNVKENMNTQEFELRIVSQNVRGIREYKKRKNIFHNLCKRADVTLLQETHSLEKDIKIWNSSWAGEILYAHGTNRSRGVAILVKDSSQFNKISSLSDKDGRFIFLKAKIKDNVFVIANVYAPNTQEGHCKFIEYVHRRLCTFIQNDDCHIILGGDLNFTHDNNLDREGGNPEVWHRSKAKWEDFIEELDLVDIWRVRNERVKQFTWRRTNPVLIQSRLDQWWISDHLQTNTETVEIKPGVKSDHSAIFLHLKFGTSNKRGPAYWRFNNSLLQDEQFVTKMKEIIPKVLEQTNVYSARERWDLLKYEIKRESIKLSKVKAKKQRERITELEKKIKIMEIQLGVQSEEGILKELEIAKLELDGIYDKITEGLILRSRVDFYEKGEKNTKYFLNQIKRNKSKSSIDKLQSEEGSISDSKIILKKLREFYEGLYKNVENKTDAEFDQSLFTDQHVKTLNKQSHDLLERDITERELLNTLKSFAKNKSPGNDGITAEFYLYFWNLVSKPLLDCYKESYKEGEMCTSQKQSVISLIEKPGKNKMNIKNWRPISLINVDAKIISKCLAMRMQEVLPDIIHPNQVGYVKNRFIGEGILTIQNVLQYTDMENIPGILMAIDFQKAFDTLNWNFMYKCLEKFNFGEYIIQWIKTLYKDIQACVMNNGLSTGYFPILRGVRQGDPVSPYLFIIALEMLAIKIRSEENIKGIVISTEHKISMYADDMTLMLKDLESVEKLLVLLEKFGNLSGLRINKEKSEAMWIGAKKHCKDTPLGLSWTKGLKITGVFFTYDTEVAKQVNLDCMIESLRAKLNLWKSRNLSLLGRIQIVKTFGLSKFLFITNMVAVPKDVINKIEKLVFNFLWSGPDKVKRNVAVGDYIDGGLQVPDVKSRIVTQRVLWIKRLLYGKEHSWKEFPRFLLEKYGGINILNGRTDVVFLKSCLKNVPFYLELIEAWKKVNGASNSEEAIYNTSIWCNTDVKIGGRSVYYKDLSESGLNKVADLYRENGSLHNWMSIKREKNFTERQVMKWNSLISAVPKSWLKLSHEAIGIIQRKELYLEYNNNPSDLENVVSKEVYCSLVKQKTEKSTASKYYCDKYGIDRDEYLDAYHRTFTTTIESKLRSFQLKLLHNILYTNAKLYTMGIVDTANCTLCKNAQETVAHLMYSCIEAKSLWNKIVFKWCSKIGISNITEKDVIFGINTENGSQTFINHVILTGKFYLYKCRVTGSKVCFNELCSLLRYTELIERKIAESKSKEMKHNAKWQQL